ncbi:MAG: DeoR family transcriptional regulator [Chloroflexi bacterium]|nr:DeoR family transcriptional regulator [Chloroflexota bacterium]
MSADATNVYPTETPIDAEGPKFTIIGERDGRKVAEALAAMANTDGGEICLVNLNSAAEATDLWESACQQVRPPPVIAPPEAQPIDGAIHYRLNIPRSANLHALSDGRVLIRRGSQNAPLGGTEIQRLVEDKNSGIYEETAVEGASFADFDDSLLNEYVEKRSRRSRWFSSIPIAETLTEVRALDDKKQATISGILTFCENPQRWLPQSSIVFVKFIGVNPRGVGGQLGYSRREEITGALPRLIERTWQYIWSEMAVSAVVQGLEREETSEYPPFAVREAIVNAVCHRDYRMRGRRIEVRMFADRLEVISPGGLPGFVTVENLVNEHYSRNPRIVQNLFQWGYIEGLGLGIDRMIEVMREAGQQAPTFDARENSFTVTLYNSRVPQNQAEHPPPTNPRQDQALEYLRQNGRITNREFKTLCADVSTETLRLDLADLVRKGLIQRLGSKKGTRYILPSY